jgi:hypothetical protein
MNYDWREFIAAAANSESVPSMRVPPEQYQAMVQSDAYKSVQQRIMGVLNQSYNVVTDPRAGLDEIRMAQGFILFAETWLRAPDLMFAEQRQLQRERPEPSTQEQGASSVMDEVILGLGIGVDNARSG